MAETDSAQHPHIYRAILKKRWFDRESRTVNPVAFVLRTKKGETGLSVLKNVIDCSRDRCVGGFRDCFGEFVLGTEQTRLLGLEVIDDDPASEDFSEHHAAIVGIPVNPITLEEKRRAEDFAQDLANLATLHHDRLGSFV